MSEFVQITAEQRDQLVAEALERGRAEGRTAAESSIEERLTAARTEGAAAERARIQAVEAQSMKGHEELIQTLKFDGKTTGPEAAVQVLAAEKTKKGDRLKDLRNGAPAPTQHAEAPDSEATEEKKLDAKTVADRARAYKAAQAKLGITVSDSQAVAHVREEMGAPAKTTR